MDFLPEIIFWGLQYFRTPYKKYKGEYYPHINFWVNWVHLRKCRIWMVSTMLVPGPRRFSWGKNKTGIWPRLVLHTSLIPIIRITVQSLPHDKMWYINCKLVLVYLNNFRNAKLGNDLEKVYFLWINPIWVVGIRIPLTTLWTMWK